MSDVAITPEEIERKRDERRFRFALVDAPLMRLGGSALLSLAVFIHLRYVARSAWLAPWGRVTLLLAVWWTLAYLAVRLFARRTPPVDLTALTLAADLAVWSYAVYATGAEESPLFFILLMRVADQTHYGFRRCVVFAFLATAAFGGMLGWSAVVAHHPIDAAAAVSRTAFVFFGGLYVSIIARAADRRRAELTKSMRTSRELIRQLQEQSFELRDARQHAEEASAAKSEFLANMSHEMRTPLHGVLGMLQLASEEETSPQAARQLEMAQRAAESLLGTIDDILDFAKIEARKIELEPVYFSLRSTLNDTMKALGVAAAGRGLTLAYYVHPDVPDTVWGDPMRLRQVLVNLVGNAVKFTIAGEVAVRVGAAGDKLRFEVRDTGIGMDADVRARIFEPFAQADSSHARRYGGTGLGLAIVARLVEALGGTIEVDSQPGRGSVFAFTADLPSDPVGSAARREPWESHLSGMSILVIEPNETARGFIAEMLRTRGVFAMACGSATDAPAGRFSCAVTADPAVAVEPKVVITSPLAQVTDAHVRVTRPVGERELIDAIGLALGLFTPRRLERHARVPDRGRRLRILLAEDQIVNQEFAAEALRRLGHSVSVASDGEAALRKLGAETFDVVLMDVQMPGLDGLEVTRRYRFGGGSTPIVALTAHTLAEDRERCLAAGMNAVLIKPIDRQQLAQTLAAVTAANPLVEAVGGNLSLLARVSDAFARQTPPLVAAMRAAIAGGDAASLRESAHKLKGSVSHFAGDPSASLAAEIETAARASDFPRAAALIPRLEAALADLGAALAKAGDTAH